MINFNQIIGPIEKAIVRWTQHYSLASPVKSIEDLTNAEVFIYFLRKVPYFQFTQPYTYENFTQLSLGERISRMKLIGRSIMAYYQVEMMRDMGETHFNYVEMCTGNKEEIIRLVIMFMGIIVTSFEILRELDDYINNSQEEITAYMKIMVDYAKKMSEKNQQDNDSPIKKQKRLITRLQIMEEQIQFYEEFTKELQGKVERLTEESEKYQRKILQNDSRAIQMLKRIEQLQMNNEENLRQICKKSSNQELLNSKLAKNRQLADETIGKLIQDIEKQKQQTIFYKKMLLRYEQVQASNKELILTNCELEKEIAALRIKFDKNIDGVHKKQAQLYQLKKINHNLSLENDSLKLKIELIQKSFTNNRSIHFSPEQKSIVMHNPLDLSSTSNRNNFNWFNFKEKQSEQQRMGESLTLTLKSNESFIQNRLNAFGMQENKENNMNIGNIAPSMKCDLSNLVQQKSFEIDIEQVNTLMKLKEERDQQFEFAIQMITEIYDYMEGLRKQLRKYQLKEAKQFDRELIFKQKVKNMFA